MSDWLFLLGCCWQDRSGSGALLIDGKKQYAIAHWFQMTGPQAIAEVETSLRDGPFQFGPWGESLSIMHGLFLTSVSDLVCLPNSDMVPVSNEDNIPINWTLPMTEQAQGMLFRRIRLSFEKSTAIIESPADRKKYRMNEAELVNLRNLICLWCQIRDFCSTGLDKFVDLDQALQGGSFRDHELREVLEQRPPSFSVSMLPSHQREALEKAREQEQGTLMEVEAERVKVRQARWQFFQSGLERDQAQLRQVESAPAKVQLVKHRKTMAWRLGQAQQGEKVVKAYMDKFMRCHVVAKVEHAQQKINEYRTFVVPWTASWVTPRKMRTSHKNSRFLFHDFWRFSKYSACCPYVLLMANHFWRSRI